MSKKKVIEYNGKLSETNPNKSNHELNKDAQQSNHKPLNNSNEDRDNNFNDNNQSPYMDGYDNELEDEKNNPNIGRESDSTNDISEKDFDIDDNSSPRKEDLSSGNNKEDGTSGEDVNKFPDEEKDGQTSSDLQNKDNEGGGKSPSDLHNEEKGEDGKSPSDLHNEEKDNDNLDIGKDNSPNEKSDLNHENDKDAKEESDLEFDSEKDKSGMKDKALDSIAPDLSKGLKLKELSEMNKKEAAEQLADTAKSMAKKKIAATIVTYISPILLPLAIILIVLILLITIIMSIIAQNNQDERMNDAQKGCKVTDKASSNISDSKDAEKNAMNIYKYAKKNVKGSTDKGTASWLGNLHEESGGTFSASTIQGGAKFKESIAKDPNAGGYAFGFAQLDSDRRVKLLEYADKKNKKWSDMGLQLDYVLNHDGSDSKLIKKLIKRDSDIKGITEDIMNQWERAGAKDSLPKRQAAASKYYSKISKIDTDDSNISDATSSSSDNSDAGSKSGCNTDSNSKVDGELGDSTKANGKKGKILKQWKSKDDIPKKYRKYIKLPDFKGKNLNTDKNPFRNGGLKGQCTELTYNYMSELYKGDQPTNGNGNQIYNAYKQKGAKTTSKPTVGYGFSSDPPYIAATTSAGHTGVVIGVMKDGKFLITNYNMNGEANKDQSRVETFALVDGNPKKGGATFFSGVGGAKIKSK